MTISQIAEILRTNSADGRLELKDTTIEAVRLGGLLNLLEAGGLVFNGVEIKTPDENTVSVIGTASVFGAQGITLEATFKDADGTVTFDLSAKRLPTCRISGAAWLNLQDVQLALQVTGTANEVTGSISGTIRTGTSEISTVFLVGKVEGELVMQWTIAQIDLSAIAQTFLDGASMPPDLPNFSFKNVEAIVKPTSRAFSFQATTAEPLNFPASGDGFSISQTKLAISRVVMGDALQPTSQINCAIAISGEKPLKIAEELTLEHFELDFDLKGQEWSVSGEVAAKLFEQPLTLTAQYSHTQDESSFKLSTTADSAIALVNWDEMGHFSVSHLAIELAKHNSESTPATTTSAWSLIANGAIKVKDVIDFQGNLTLYKQTDEGAGLVFKPERGTVHITLPPNQTASVDLEFGDISILRQSSTDPTRQKPEWAFESSVDLSIHGLNQTVQKYWPQTIKTTFKANRQSVTLTADRVLNPFDFVIPDIEISQNTKIDLGTASIDVSNLSIRLGKDIELAAQLGIGLPAKLNNLFGVKEDGTPSVQFFNTFDPSDREHTVVSAQLSIGTAGIKIVPTSSIIQAIHLVEENGESWWYCTLGDNGEFGEVKFKVPVFSYDTANSSFKASGAFETIKPLVLPLTPAKLLLSACKLQGAADALPKGLPLKEVKIVDDQGNFKVEALLAELGDIGAHLPADIKDSLKTIGDHLDQLPDSFKQYLNIQIPQSFAFDIAVTPEGTVRFDARVKEGDPPIKLLLPGMLGPVPVLNGIELRSISFGELAGGSLFLLQVDATVDQFDLATLATSVLLPEIQSNPLPPTRTLHRRLVLDKLFAVIVYQTGIPIPIPLFYDKIGVEYLGLEGLQLGAHAQFPMPTLNLAEAGKLMSNFKQFFTDRNYLLDPQASPQNMNLIFSLQENFIELPKYLGGKLLGDPQGGPQINAYQNLARLMNGMKTLSVNELIQAMPLQNRVGSTGISFGPLSSNVGWLVTTPNEFRQIASQPGLRQIAYQQLGLSTDAQANGILAVLSSATPSENLNEQGLVVFLKGSCQVSNLASFETVFGLAASSSMGFNTGFKMAGQISHVMDMEVAGRVAINGKSNPAFRLEGHSYLNLLNQRIFQGDVQMIDQRFQCQGTLNLFGLGGSVAMNIDGAKGADIQGELNAIDLKVFKLTGINGKPNPSVFIQILPNQVPTMDISGAVELLGLRSETHINVSDSSFLFETSGTIFNRFNCILKATGNRLSSADNFRVAATMQNDLFQFLKTEASQVIKQEADKAATKIGAVQENVRKAQADVDSLNTQISNQREVVRQERIAANRKLEEAKQAVIAEQQKVNNLISTIQQKEAERDRLAKQQKCTTVRIWVPTPTKWKPWDGHWENKTTCIPDPTGVVQAGKLQAEITGLYTQLGAEKLGLEAAQKTLELLQKGIVSTPIDADPRVAGLISSLEVATQVLKAANGSLEATKTAVGTAAAASDYISRYGLDALLQVKSASFAADLNTASGGQVSMTVNLTYKGSNLNLPLNFNFNSPLTSAQALGRMLLS